MNNADLRQEVEVLEQWFRQFPDPKLSESVGRSLRLIVRAELNPLELETPQPSDSLKEKIKWAVRQELFQSQRPIRLARFKLWRPVGALAAMVALAVGISFYTRPSSSNNLTEVALGLTWSIPTSPQLSELDAELAQMELRTYVQDYLLTSAEQDHDELRQSLEQWSRGDYEFDFSQESNL